MKLFFKIWQWLISLFTAAVVVRIDEHIEAHNGPIHLVIKESKTETRFKRSKAFKNYQSRAYRNQ